MRFNHLLLFSKDPEQLANFLSSFLDLEIASHPDGIKLEFEDLQILIAFLPGRKYRARGETVIELVANTREELENIISKSQFVEYRLGLKELNKKLVIQKASDFYYLDLHDPDGRVWRVAYYPEVRNC